MQSFHSETGISSGSYLGTRPGHSNQQAFAVGDRTARLQFVIGCELSAERWWAATPDYRAYIIGRDGRFIKSVELQCADDEQAKAHAKQLVDDHDIELWQRDRLIDKFKSE